ncbi:MAG: DHHA1 domain-containing protein [Pyrinomonadaceae bacterium]
MDAARAVVELFEAPTVGEARRLAEHLEARNRERQIMQREITERAIAELECVGDSQQPHVAVIAGDNWHRGVIGLAASKISERLGRPAIVISCDGETGHGSARSTEDYHLLDGLTACADLLEQFGGHAHAAGMCCQRVNIQELRRRLNEHASHQFSGERRAPALHIDARLAFADINLALAEDLSLLQPFGANWHTPVFATANLHVVAPTRIMKERHLKLRLADEGQQHELEAVWWGGAEIAEQTPNVGDCIELAYSIEINTWRGATRLQLVVEDMKVNVGC